VFSAALAMGQLDEKIYTPIPENKVVYDKIYAEYSILHDYFGRGENNVMKHMKEIKKQVKKA